MSQYELEMAFWKWLLIALGGIGLMWIIGNHIEEILQGIVDFFGFVGSGVKNLKKKHYHPSPKRLHKKRAREWRRALPILSRIRIDREIRDGKRKDEWIVRNAMAESLATHQEILEEFYGEKAPSASEIMQRMQNK